MTRASTVPVTPAVLRWAIDESGYSLPDIADAAHVDAKALRDWLAGKRAPGLTDARSLASVLKRPLAALLLPAPPESKLPAVEYRRGPGVARSAPTFSERLHLREAARIQQILAWIAQEISMPAPSVPNCSLNDDAANAGADTRQSLGVSVEVQTQWASVSQAFHGWRDALENVGVYVLVSSMGTDGCRGFSLSHERAPLIVVNSAWNMEARTFTLLHEFGHLRTRTSSVCLDADARTAEQRDAVERWCEVFAAAVLLPRDEVKAFAKSINAADESLAATAKLARRFKVSLRAAALRLIELGIAKRSLYSALPPLADHKSGGGGGGGRTRDEIRREHFGARAISVFQEALRADVLSVGDVGDYLDMAPDAGATPLL